MPAIINFIPNINIFVYFANAVLLISMAFKPKLIRSVLMLLTMGATFALLRIENHLTFVTTWVWVSVLLFLTSLQTDSSSARKNNFSQYATYIIVDTIFFFMSLLLEVKFGKLFLILPIIARCNLVPFQFFASVGNSKNLKHELQLTSINFLSVFIFLHKFNVDSILLIKLIGVSLFVTSFRFIKSSSSTNSINLFYITLLNMCVFLATHGFSQFAHTSFAFFMIVFILLSFFVPKNIPANTLRYIDNYEKTPEKIFPVVILTTTAFIPFSFASKVYLSVFELITFKTWYIGQNHFVALLLFCLIIWFMVNINCVFSLIFNLVTHLQPKDGTPTRVKRFFMFGLLLPAILLFASSYLFIGQSTFISTPSIVPIQTVKANIEQYILYFFLPILFASLFGVYLRKILDLAKFLLPIYSSVLKITSLYLLYTKISFSNIQKFISESVHMTHRFMRIIYRFPKSIYTYFTLTRTSISSIYKKVDVFIKKILDFKLTTSAISENFHILLLFMTLLTIALSSTLNFSIISIVIMTLTAFIIGYFLSTHREDPK